MNFGRIIGAGVIGGIIMFAWGALSHMALPIGEMGVKPLPQEEAIVGAMKSAMNEHALYMFPSFDANDDSEAAMTALGEKYKAGPRGIIVFDPTGGEMMGPVMLATEFGSNVLAAILVAMVISGVRAPYFCRVLGVVAFGLVAWLSVDISYWNWYRFPTPVMLGSMIEHGVGYFLAGLGIAALVGKGCNTMDTCAPATHPIP